MSPAATATGCRIFGHTVTSPSHGHVETFLTLAAGGVYSRDGRLQRGSIYPPRVLSTYKVECRDSIIGTTIMVWASIPHTSTSDPLGTLLFWH